MVNAVDKIPTWGGKKKSETAEQPAATESEVMSAEEAASIVVPVTPPTEELEATASTGEQPKGELTEVQEAEKALEDANKARLEAWSAYREILNENEAFSSAGKAAIKAYQDYREALRKSGKADEAFLAASPEGKRLYDECQRLAEILTKAEEAFNATPSGKDLYDKWRNLDTVSYEAGKALRQAKAKPAS